MHRKRNMIITYIFILFIFPVIMSIAALFAADRGYIPKLERNDLLYYINIFSYTLIPFLCFIILRSDFSSDIKKMGKHLLKVIPFVLIVFATSILGNIAINYFDHTSTTANQQMLQQLQATNMYFTTYMTVVAAPIAEESVFRCSLISTRGGFRGFVMLIISSALFSLVHLQSITIGAFIAYALIGVVLGIIYMKYRNLVLNILVHSGYNALSIILSILLKNYL